MNKLSQEDKQEIKRMYDVVGMSIRSIARWYNVSRATIYFVLDPEKAEKNKVANRERQRQKRQRSE